jgi:Na+-transporting methylmalonyl-CoA/oxaloacetate decarboxylase gamma subunit
MFLFGLVLSLMLLLALVLYGVFKLIERGIFTSLHSRYHAHKASKDEDLFNEVNTVWKE